MKLLCTSCNLEKPTSEFFHKKPYKDGSREFSYDCKDCRRLNRRKNEKHEDDFVTLKNILFGDGQSSDPALKKCRVCGETKIPGIDFYSKKNVCITCTALEQRDRYEQCDVCSIWRKKGSRCPKKCKPYVDLRCSVCKRDGGATPMYSTRLCLECKETGRLRSQVKKYGLTIQEFELLKSEQGGTCKICHSTDARRLSIDHDHATGAVRGLLCTNCNLGLGNFHDKIDLLLEAVKYLQGST